jgi:hypothetical protein
MSDLFHANYVRCPAFAAACKLHPNVNSAARSIRSKSQILAISNPPGARTRPDTHNPIRRPSRCTRPIPLHSASVPMRRPLAESASRRCALNPSCGFPRRSSNANSLCGQNSVRSRESVRPFKGIICGDISEFESYHPSHAVGSLRTPDGFGCQFSAQRKSRVSGASIGRYCCSGLAGSRAVDLRARSEVDLDRPL